MTTEIKVPVLPESVADATIANWHVKIGDKIQQDQNIVDIETDKVVLEVVAPSDGVITEILHDVGDTVLGEQKIAVISTEANASPAPTTAQSTSNSVPSEPSSSAVAAQLFEVKVPVLPESVADATIASWHVQPGQSVQQDEKLVDIETDKVVLEVVAEANGVIGELLAQEGDTVLAEQVITQLTSGSNATQAPAPVTNNDTDAASVASPSTRRLAAENEVNVGTVSGSGKGGRVTKDDVNQAIQQRQAPTPASATTPAPTANKPATMPSLPVGDRSQKRVPMTRLRKTIAKRMLNAKHDTAMLTTFNEVNMQPIMDLRRTYKDLFEQKHGTRLGFMPFFLKAVIEALKRYPAVNASIDADEIVYHNYFDVSIAVSTPRGLVTPVLRDCDRLNFAEVEIGIKQLAAKGRDGKLTLEDMQGGNFTITNGGVFGSLMSTPILNPPQSAILGMHKIQERPMAVNGQVVILPMMYLALSYDHRLIDGKESVGFLVSIKELLEDPTRLLLDI